MQHLNIQNVFRQVAARRGSAVAMEHGAHRISYAQLEDRSSRLAHALVRHGIGAGDLVTIMSADPIQVTTAMLGILEVGAVFVPLDPSFPPARLRRMLEQAPPRGVVADGAGATVWEALGVVTETFLSLDDETTGEAPQQRVGTPLDGDAPCSIFFTSGSTGRSKAILGRLKGIAHFAQWEAELLEIEDDTRVSQLASPSFDGFLKDVFAPLCVGGTACAPESRGLLLEPARLVDWIDVEGIEILHVVPSVLRSLLSQALDPKYFADLRWVVLAGEVLQRSDVRRWRDVFGDRIRLLNLYGPTETTVTKLFHIVEARDLERPSIPIGQPMRGAAVAILDAGSRPCSPGDVGEIVLRTPFRSLGYYGDPEATRQVFVPNPLGKSADDLVYRTGDFGRVLADGKLEFLGRRDQQVKIRGVRIEMGEVETLLREHPAVRDAAVVDRDDAEGGKILCAFLVLAPGTDSAPIRDHLAAQLPEAMVPSLLVALDDLPRTLNGKVDRRALPTLQQLDQARRDRSLARARTPVEELLAGIWSSVLKLERVGVDESFFELGGHSLLATQVILRIRETLGVELPLRTLFEAPTISRLARCIETAAHGHDDAIEPIRRAARSGMLPLSYPQQRMWLLEQLSAGSSAFNIPLGMRVRGALDLAALEMTFGEVIRRHEVLRTTFPARDGVPEQVIGPPVPLTLPRLDLGALPTEARERELHRIATRDTRRPFDLATGPLLRIHVARLAEDQHVVFCTLHHLVADAWSFDILLAETGRLYDAFHHRRPSPFEELAVQYVDYAIWQREQARGEDWEKRRAYWRRQLAGAPDHLALPHSRPRRAVPSFRGARHPTLIEPELAAALRDLGQREGTTLFMTVLAGFLVLLHQYTGERDLVVGSVIANRDRPEVAPLIGFLANTLVLRFDLAGAPDYRQLLTRVREVCLGAFTHQLPPEALQEGMAPGDRLFDVWFQMESAQRETLTLAGLTWERFETERSNTRFELSLVLEDDGDEIRGELEYDADLFDSAIVAQMAEDLSSVLAEMAREPEQVF